MRRMSRVPRKSNMVKKDDCWVVDGTASDVGDERNGKEDEEEGRGREGIWLDRLRYDERWIEWSDK